MMKVNRIILASVLCKGIVVKAFLFEEIQAFHLCKHWANSTEQNKEEFITDNVPYSTAVFASVLLDNEGDVYLFAAFPRNSTGFLKSGLKNKRKK